jgi:phosphoserine phosphatase
MTPHTIIWDFDGTLYPLLPYDSEQILMRLIRKQSNRGARRFQRIMGEWVSYGDMHQWFRGTHLRKLYNRLYGYSIKGTPVSLLANAIDHISALITPEDRNALHRLHRSGFRMLVISCGTLDLCEGVLQKAGVRDCFESVTANPFLLKNGTINGVNPRVVNAHDKLFTARKLVGKSPEGIAAVGDGYTDIPLLDWVQYPVMMDPDHSKQSKYATKPYCFTPSVVALSLLLTRP